MSIHRYAIQDLAAGASVTTDGWVRTRGTITDPVEDLVGGTANSRDAMVYEFRAATSVTGGKNPSAVWEWQGVPTGNETEVLARFELVGAGIVNIWLGVSLTTDSSGDGLYALLTATATPALELGNWSSSTWNVLDTQADPGLTDGSWWMRARCEPSGANRAVRVRLWQDGTPEPSTWNVETTSQVDRAGYPGVGGQKFRTNSPNVSELAWTSFTYADSGETIGVTPYVRQNVQEDAGSILELTQAEPSEVSASQAVAKDVTLQRGLLHSFLHPLSSAVLFSGYPHAVPNAEHLNTYTFETKVGRMARTFPPKIWERVDKIPALASALRDEDGALDATGDRVTAQAALQYIFDQWAATYSWFSAETVPDLRTWWPSEDYSGTNGVVYVLAVRIRQERDRRKSMLDILREYLSPFSITPRQNSAGSIELRPQHGPDADAAPTKTLTHGDIVWPGLSDGGADERFAKNLVTVTNQGDIRSPDVQVMESAWLQVASSYNFGSADVLYTPPANARNLNPGEDADGNPDELTTLAHGLARLDPFCDQGCRWFWAVGADSIPAGEDGILLTSSSGTKQITAGWITGDHLGGRRSSGPIAPSDIEVNTIPYSGETVDAIKLTHSDTYATIRGRWNEERGGVELSWGGGKLETSMALPPRYTWTFEINLQDASVGITEGPVQTATVGTITDGEANATLPGTDGGNAIIQSQAANGINEARIDIRVYTLEPSALADIGLGYLRDNIDPRVIRTGEQSPENGMPIVPDDIGHLVQLGDGSEAIVLSCGFQMDFSPGHGSPVLRSPVRFLVVNDPVVDTDLVPLLDESDVYLLDESGAILEDE